MKAIDILNWVVRYGVNGVFLGIIDVPNDDEKGLQSEEWWFDNLGACPPSPIEGGKYIWFHSSDIEDGIVVNGAFVEPDAECEVMYDYDYILLYRLED